MKVPNNFLLYVTILSLSFLLVSRGIRDLCYPRTYTQHVNEQLPPRKFPSRPHPPDPESELVIAGNVVERDYYGGPYYFKGTKVRAYWMELGEESILATTEQRISYDYHPASKTWTLTK